MQHLEAPATVRWYDPNTYKKDAIKKAEYEQKACNALSRAGCAGGTIMGGLHKSWPWGDQKPHITVKPEGKSGPKKTMHVYEDGTASMKGKGKGKIIHFCYRMGY